MTIMNAAYRELAARLDELEASTSFTAIAATLRPRLGDVLRWEAGGDAIGLAQQFMRATANRPESIYGALLVRAVAGFERFARLLVDDAAKRTAARCKKYSDIKEHVRNRHTVLTGKLLGSIEEPRDYQPVDVRQLAENLASCLSESPSFRINTSAFAAAVYNGSPRAIEKALTNLDIDNWWDAIGGTPKLQKLLGTKGARDTGKAAGKRLDEICKSRNQIAHAGDGDITVSESDLREAIAFVRALAEALSGVLDARLA